MRRFESLPAIRVAILAAQLTAILGSMCGCQGSSSASKNRSTSSRPKIEHVGRLDVQDEDGTTKKIQDYAEGKILVVVVSRGYHGSVCPFCCAQTQSLAKDYSKIEALGGKVLVIFPVEKPSEKVFSSELVDMARIVLKSDSAPMPFPIAYDVQLSAVDQLGIRAQLAKPATYIIDRQGKLRYSYVGSDPADRPNVNTIIKQLQAIQ